MTYILLPLPAPSTKEKGIFGLDGLLLIVSHRSDPHNPADCQIFPYTTSVPAELADLDLYVCHGLLNICNQPGTYRSSSREDTALAEGLRGKRP